MKSRNPKILIQHKGNLDYVDFQGIDIENNGNTDINEVDFKNGGYYNEKDGATNVEGKLNTDTSIKNSGLFNIKKTGVVNITTLKNIRGINWTKYGAFLTGASILVMIIIWLLS
ncbi:MAG: hypothetical protein WC842_00755 [Candidatus Paceibacterota bacterium]|jgi:hypothetical protein